MEHLTLQVGDLHHVIIDDADRADPGRRQIQQCGAAESAGTHHQHPGIQQPSLTVDSDLGDDEVTRITGHLVSIQPGTLGVVTLEPIGWMVTFEPIGYRCGHRSTLDAVIHPDLVSPVP